MLRTLALIAGITLPGALGATAPEGATRFASIDGGTLTLEALGDGPVLLVNTASRCAFTQQYDQLQALYDRYRDAGLTVVAVPSDDFKQELDSAEAVADFCAVNFDLDLPMTDITPILGPNAHPYYAWLAGEHGIVPRWNFHKVLIGRDGQPLAEFPSVVRPLSRPMTRAVEAALAN